MSDLERFHQERVSAILKNLDAEDRRILSGWMQHQEWRAARGWPMLCWGIGAGLSALLALLLTGWWTPGKCPECEVCPEVEEAKPSGGANPPWRNLSALGDRTRIYRAELGDLVCIYVNGATLCTSGLDPTAKPVVVEGAP